MPRARRKERQLRPEALADEFGVEIVSTGGTAKVLEAAGIPVVAEYAATGLVPRIPTMLGSLALAGCGALSFVTGLILDTVAKSHRRQWEIDVYKAMNGFYRE